MTRILVTGATGQIGREVVDQLRPAGCTVRALTRNPDQAGFPSDVEVARGDPAAPDTLDRALEAVDAIFLVWLGSLDAAKPAIARIAARTPRIVLLTSPHRTPHPFFQQPNGLRIIHAGVEELIQQSGMHWTFLRPGPFALNAKNWWAPQIAKGNVVRWFHADAETAPVHERDIAGVAVRALCGRGHEGKEYVLTGPESLTQRQQVTIVGEAIGKPLVYEELSPDVAREAMAPVFSVPVANMLLTAYGAAVGQPALVTSTIFDVTGSQARSFREWAEDHASEF